MADLVLSSRTSLAERELPLWARRALRSSLPSGARVLNGSILRHAVWGGTVLVNTTRGACLVSKTSFARARLHFLPVAGEGPLQCPSCRTEIMFAGRVRETFYCTSCGTQLRHTDRGVLTPLRGAPPNRRYAAREVLPGRPSKGPRWRPSRETLGTGIPIEHPEPIDRSKARGHRISPRKARRARVRPAPPPAPPQAPRAAPIRVRKKAAANRYQAQCAALTPQGRQCRNSSRKGSKYCISHKGYQPPALASVIGTVDTGPSVGGALDTQPSYRRTTHDGNGRERPPVAG